METTLTWLWLTHGMSHLEASMGKGSLVLVLVTSPTRLWCSTATTATRLGHRCSGINVADKEKHCSMGNVLDCGYIIVLWNLSLIEEYILD